MALEKIRERFGQAAVDATLHVVAQSLESATAADGLSGRWLEQDFLAILTECNEERRGASGRAVAKDGSASACDWLGRYVERDHFDSSDASANMDTAGGMVGRAEAGMRKAATTVGKPDCRGDTLSRGGLSMRAFDMFVIIGIVVVNRGHSGRLPDGAWQFEKCSFSPRNW